MGYDLEIKGWMSEVELRRIEQIARKYVPAGGLVVEIGVAHGRSTYAWASSIPPNARVIALDSWENGLHIPFINRVASRPDVWSKIIPLKLKSPPIGWRYPKADVIFIDGEHKNPDFHIDIQFWKDHVKKGGVLCGHDYNAGFGEAFDSGEFERPDIIKEVDALSKAIESPLLFTDFSTPPITLKHVDMHELPNTMMSIWAMHIW